MQKNILIHQTTVKKTSYLCPKLKKTNGKRSPHGAVAHFSRDTIINSHRAIWQNFIFGDMKKLLLMTVLGMLAVGGMEAQNESGSNTATSGSIPTSALRAEGNYWTLDQAAESYAGGTGTEADPYLIATPEQFIKLCLDTNQKGTAGRPIYCEGIYFKQTADLDFSEAYTNYLRVGVGGDFAGTYDGGNFALKGLRYYANASENIPSMISFSPFFHIDGATIKNVIIEDLSVDFTYSNIMGSALTSGMLVDYAYNSTIENCKVSGNISANLSGYCGLYIGGISSVANNTTINNCHATGSINAKMTITEALDDSDIYSSVGGITSEAIGPTTIHNCTTSVDIYNETHGNTTNNFYTRVAGMSTWNMNNLHIINCSNTGNLKASGNNSVAEKNLVEVGGLIAFYGGDIIENSWVACEMETTANGADFYYNPLVYTQGNSYGLVECVYDRELLQHDYSTDVSSRTTEYMQSQEFVDRLNSHLTEDGLPWQYIEGSYPVLGTSEEQPEDPTASESISKSDISFRIVPGAVVITAPEATQFAAYTFTGAMQATQLIPAGTTTVNLPAGLYILKIGEETHKVNVK